MQIFHAAPTAFSIPDPNMFEGSRDFGPALYCSLDYISAARYLQRRLNGNGVILTSDIPIDIRHSHDDVATGLSVYVFDYQNPEDQADWVRQIVANRGWYGRHDGSFREFLMGYDIYFGYRADAELDAALEPFLNDAALLSWDNTDKLAELFQVEFFKQHVYAEQLSLNYKACNVLFSMSGRELSVVS